MSDDISVRFSDEEARSILARAIEIEARAPMTTTADLRAIAAEIGVSSASLDAALREQTTSVKVQRIAAAQRVATLIAGVGVPLGATAGWLLSSGAILPVLGLMGVGLVASGGLAVYQSATGSLRAFQVKNLVLWGGVYVGSVAALALLGDGVSRVPVLMAAGWCLRSWIASSILGSAAVVAVRRSRSSESGDVDAGPAEASGVSGGNRWARVAKRILASVFRPLRFGHEQIPVATR